MYTRLQGYSREKGALIRLLGRLFDVYPKFPLVIASYEKGNASLADSLKHKVTTDRFNP